MAQALLWLVRQALSLWSDFETWFGTQGHHPAVSRLVPLPLQLVRR